MDIREMDSAGPPPLSMRNPASPYYIGRVRKHLLIGMAVLLAVAGFAALSDWASMRADRPVVATLVAVSGKPSPEDSSLQYFTYTFVFPYRDRTCVIDLESINPGSQPGHAVGDTMTIMGWCSETGRSYSISEYDGPVPPPPYFHISRIAVFGGAAGVCLLLFLVSPLLIRPADRLVGRRVSGSSLVRVVNRPQRFAVIVAGISWGFGLYQLLDQPPPDPAASLPGGVLMALVAVGIGLLVVFLSWLTGFGKRRLTVTVDETGVTQSRRGKRVSMDFADIVSASYVPSRQSIEFVMSPAEGGSPLGGRDESPAAKVINLVNLTFGQRLRIFRALQDRVPWTGGAPAVDHQERPGGASGGASVPPADIVTPEPGEPSGPSPDDLGPAESGDR